MSEKFSCAFEEPALDLTGTSELSFPIRWLPRVSAPKLQSWAGLDPRATHAFNGCHLLRTSRLVIIGPFDLFFKKNSLRGGRLIRRGEVGCHKNLELISPWGVRADENGGEGRQSLFQFCCSSTMESIAKLQRDGYLIPSPSSTFPNMDKPVAAVSSSPPLC